MENETRQKPKANVEGYRKFLISNIYLITVVVVAIIVVLVGIAIVKGRQTSSGSGVKPAQEAQQSEQSTNPSYVSPTFSPMPAAPTKTLPETGSDIFGAVLLLACVTLIGFRLRGLAQKTVEL